MSALKALFPHPEIKSALGRYQLLAPNAGLRVSPLCLGGMNFGNKWAPLMGDITKEEAFKIMDAYYEAGGNFLDTANLYQQGESEEWIGEWMEKRGNRHEIVLATKFSSIVPIEGQIKINFVGNAKKSLHVSVEQSLKRLRTNYIDILYVHWWDYTTSIEEVVHSLNNLVTAGKVLYLGISDTPAWIVAAANTYAKDHGLAQFVLYQGRWNALQREFERDILPMCRHFGLGLAPWNVLNMGKFAKFPEQNASEDKGRTVEPLTEKETQVLNALATVAKELNATVAQISIAYVLHKAPFNSPIIGGRKPSHLLDNIKALDIKLTEDHIKLIEGAVPFEIGFPHDFIGSGVRPNYEHMFVSVGGKIVKQQCWAMYISGTQW